VMDVWKRLTAEPARLKAALSAKNRRQLGEVLRRLQSAVATLDGRRPGAPQYVKLASAAAELGVHPKTIERWLAADAPTALLKRRRMTLVARAAFDEWKARLPAANGGRHG